MAIQPIDLQTLFAQVEKVGKMQAAQKEGAALQQSIQNAEMQKKLDEQLVNETQNTGEGGTEKTKDKKGSDAQSQNKGKGKNKEQLPGEDGEKDDVFRDLALGKNIDVSF